MKTNTILLLIDDDADDTNLFRDVLAEVDPSVIFRSAVNGDAGLKQLKNTTPLPDLIFLDLNMPMMNGKECLLSLKQDEKLRNIPVIMYTTSSLSADIEETMQNGAICFIVKPSNIIEMKYILSNIIAGIKNDLAKRLRMLSESATSFIVC